jgi:hypothetical protein
MKRSYILAALITASFASSCMSRKNPDGSNRGSFTKSVTINQPDLKAAMNSSLSEEEKQKIIDSLVYSISIKPVQVEGKDDCAESVVATKFESGVVAMDKSTFDAIKVKKGCSYLVSMKFGARSDDGKSIKTLYISSWDDKKPSILSRAELEKSKPVAAVSLYVTEAGKAYWDADVIETPTDTDTTIDPTLSKSFSLKAEKISVTKGADGLLASPLDLTPNQALKKELFCGVGIKVDVVKTQTGPVANEDIVPRFLFIDSAVEKSIIKVKAGSVEKITLPKLAEFSQPVGDEAPTIKSSTAYAYCFEVEADALRTLKECREAMTNSGAEGQALTLSPAKVAQCAKLSVIK